MWVVLATDTGLRFRLRIYDGLANLESDTPRRVTGIITGTGLTANAREHTQVACYDGYAYITS